MNGSFFALITVIPPQMGGAAFSKSSVSGTRCVTQVFVPRNAVLTLQASAPLPLVADLLTLLEMGEFRSEVGDRSDNLVSGNERLVLIARSLPIRCRSLWQVLQWETAITTTRASR